MVILPTRMNWRVNTSVECREICSCRYGLQGLWYGEEFIAIAKWGILCRAPYSSGVFFLSLLEIHADIIDCADADCRGWDSVILEGSHVGIHTTKNISVNKHGYSKYIHKPSSKGQNTVKIVTRFIYQNKVNSSDRKKITLLGVFHWGKWLPNISTPSFVGRSPLMHAGIFLLANKICRFTIWLESVPTQAVRTRLVALSACWQRGTQTSQFRRAESRLET